MKANVPAKMFRKAKFALFGEPLFQHKRAAGTELRMGKILNSLDGTERSCLDLGSNAGLVTRAMADRGMISFGFDINPDAVKQANDAHQGVQGIGFALLKMSPESAAKLPQVDVIFCLSVFHYWVNEYGEEAAWQMVATMISKCRMFFFEPSSAHYKYQSLGLKRPPTAPAPAFKNLDAASVQEWVESNMKRIAPDRSLEMLASIPCIAEDHFRLLFVSKSTVSPKI